MNNIFVGNLSFTATKEDVQKLFEPFGTVANVVIMERKKGKSRGYGFVDMPNEEEKNKAIAALEGKEFMWRALSVSPVVPKAKGEWAPKKKFKPVQQKPYPREDHYQDRETKPWIKHEGGSKPPYKKFDSFRPQESRPYRKDDRSPKPYSKFSSSKTSTWGKPKKDFKPYKPWVKKEDKDREFKPRENARPERKSYKKSEVSSKPFSKPGGAFKKFYKPSSPSSKPWPKKGQGRT